MAYREVTVDEIREVVRRWLDGTGLRAIARQGVADRKTVRRYIAAAQECGLKVGDPENALSEELLGAVVARLGAVPSRPHGSGWELCLAHRDFIGEQIGRGLRLTKVRKLLQRRAVSVPYATLWRFASAELGFGETRATIPVADCGPGEELQIDSCGKTVRGLHGRSGNGGRDAALFRPQRQ